MYKTHVQSPHDYRTRVADTQSVCAPRGWDSHAESICARATWVRHENRISPNQVGRMEGGLQAPGSQASQGWGWYWPSVAVKKSSSTLRR